jgi:putative phosphoribosyl transferase
VRDEDVAVNAGLVRLVAHLSVPEHARGAVIFVHGSGSSRHSPRNRYVATVLNRARLATLLFDLLTPGEEHDRANVFDIGLLARRLVDVTDWLRKQPEIDGLPIGYSGASTEPPPPSWRLPSGWGCGGGGFSGWPTRPRGTATR